MADKGQEDLPFRPIPAVRRPLMKKSEMKENGRDPTTVDANLDVHTGSIRSNPHDQITSELANSPGRHDVTETEFINSKDCQGPQRHSSKTSVSF